jgi:AraC-like DNA-binding protein
VIFVDLAFSTAAVAPPERLDAWRELVSRVFIPLAIGPVGGGRPGEFEGSATGSDLGGLRVWRVTASPMSAVRTSRHIAATATDDLLLALHIKGTAHATQDGREVTLHPGDFALLDSTRPYSMTFLGHDSFEHVIYQVPRTRLGGYRQLSDATAVRVPAASTPGQLVSPYLQALSRRWRTAGGQQPAQSFIDAGLDLAVSALRIVGGRQDQLDPRRRGLAGELKRYALAHLAEPGLSPEVAAQASYISVRQLHRLFAREGISFGAWVRAERLSRCRDDLTSQQLSNLAVSEIAASWGFRNAAHFSRAFTARYGIAPSQLRQASSAKPAPPGFAQAALTSSAVEEIASAI